MYDIHPSKYMVSQRVCVFASHAFDSLNAGARLASNPNRIFFYRVMLSLTPGVLLPVPPKHTSSRRDKSVLSNTLPKLNFNSVVHACAHTTINDQLPKITQHYLRCLVLHCDMVPLRWTTVRSNQLHYGTILCSTCHFGATHYTC